MKALYRPLVGLALALGSLGAGPARAQTEAETLALLPASGANVDPGTLSAAYDVLRDYLGKTGRFAVRTTSAGSVGSSEPSPVDAVALAGEVHAPVAAVLRMAVLGSVIHVRLSVYEVPSGRPVFTDELSGESRADLDPILKRLAVAFTTGGSAANSADIYTVTRKESEPLRKETATRQRGLRLGVVQAMGSGRVPNPDGIGGGAFWIFDVRSFFVDISVDYYGGAQIHELTGGFGAYVPLVHTNVSPYVGGGLRLAAIWLDGFGSGFQPYVSAGAIIGRLSDVGLRAEVSYEFDTFDTYTGGPHAGLLKGTVGVEF